MRFTSAPMDNNSAPLSAGERKTCHRPLHEALAANSETNKWHAPASPKLQSTTHSIEGVHRHFADDECLPPLLNHTLRSFESRITSTWGHANQETLLVHEPLPREAFDEKQLLDYFQNASFEEGTMVALGEFGYDRAELNENILQCYFGPDPDERFHPARYEVYDVKQDGIAIALHCANEEATDAVLTADTVWNTINTVNTSGDSVGRMTKLLDPTPVMLGATHFTMKKHFDMDELYQHLTLARVHQHFTKAFMDRAFETSEVRQRSFFFVFNYFTVNDYGTQPASWQRCDTRPMKYRNPDQIDICESSSILALSFAGDPLESVNRKRMRSKDEVGHIYSAFSPWHLLDIQCASDNVHERSSRSHFSNGPYAFLDSLAVLYRDAVARNRVLNRHITILISPPGSIMFEWRLRDKLLFEDANFTYSRRYFWAFNTLSVINASIKSMISAYDSNFTREFWAGRHPTLFWHPDPTSPQAVAYFASLKPLRHELEASLVQLRELHDENEQVRNEIKSLREQLYSGSNVKQSRHAIRQGDYIKILTIFCAIFLPLLFVTAIWSMPGFPFLVTDWQFPVTILLLTTIIFGLLAMMVTRCRYRFWDRISRWFPY